LGAVAFIALVRGEGRCRVRRRLRPGGGRGPDARWNFHEISAAWYRTSASFDFETPDHAMRVPLVAPVGVHVLEQVQAATGFELVIPRRATCL